MNFLKLGKRRINLEHLSTIREASTSSGQHYYHLTFLNGDGLDLDGNEAALLLAILDNDGEEVDRLYPVVNPAPKAPLLDSRCEFADCMRHASHILAGDRLCEQHFHYLASR